MATRGTIAVEHANGTVSQVYSHWDNYPSWNGKLLLDHYNSQELAEALVAVGDISSLAERIVPTGEHSFNSPEKGVTVFYGRDRGEEGCETSKHSSFTAYKMSGQAEEFNYIFRNGKWYCSPDTMRNFFELTLEACE